jgi:Arc/MetJ-type ribon-helix-helix transcriptional regulator
MEQFDKEIDEKRKKGRNASASATVRDFDDFKDKLLGEIEDRIEKRSAQVEKFKEDVEEEGQNEKPKARTASQMSRRSTA